MAEILLEPSNRSKIIPLSFDLNDTSASNAAQLMTKRQFNTADTDAWFQISLDDFVDTAGSFDITLFNLNDKSVFNHTGKPFTTNPFYYKLDSESDETTNEIRHAGRWIGQIVVTLANGDSATRKFIFDIEGHILDGADVQTILLEDYNALIALINTSKDLLTQYNVDYAALLVDLAAAETARTATYNQLVADQQANIDAFDVALDDGIVAANLATKLQTFEETNNSRLLSAEQQLAEINSNVKKLGAVGDGIADDVVAIKSAPSGDVFFPAGDYRIKSALPLKNGTYKGVRGKSRILIKDDFVKGGTLPSNEFAIYNENFATNYGSNANEVTIEDMILEFNFTTATTTPIAALLGLANLKKCVLRNVDIVINTTNPLYAVGFDFYAAFKNVELHNVTVYMNTNHTAGGNWIRNYSSDYTGASVCENIKIKNLKITKNCGDEHLAIYGWHNTIKNVEIDGLYLEQQTGVTVGMATMVSIFGSDIAPWNNANGKVENVKIKNFFVNAKKYTSFVFQVGNNSGEGVVKNIEISNGFIDNDCNAVSLMRGYNYCQNVKFNNNSINFLNGTKVTNAVSEVEEAVDNKFYGASTCTNLFNTVTDVVDNEALDNSSSVFAYNCKNIERNKSKVGDIFVSNQSRTRVKIKGNAITSVKANVNLINALKNTSDVSFACEFIIEDNEFIPFDATTRMIFSNNTLAVIKSKNNFSATACKYVYTTAGRVFGSQNNSIAGVIIDSLRGSVIDDWDVGMSLCNGYFVKSNVDNGQIIGWRKLGWTSGAGTWQTVKTAL